MIPKKYPGLFGILCVASIMIFCALHSRADTAADVRNFTGAPTRVVWIQDAGDAANVYSEHPTIKLMGFDTEDGKGERPILPNIGWYAKPLLTADGKRVVFANLADHTVDVVNFDGTGLRQVLKNEEAYKDDQRPFLDDAVWTDPKSGVTWVYAMVEEQREGKPVPVIRRFQLDHPEVSELIWDKTPVFMFMLSGDGREASGGIVDGGNSLQGFFTLPNGSFIPQHNGCWPSMSPDASHRMWVFQGNHRGIILLTPANRSGASNQAGFLFPAPGLNLNPGDETYHPRWTNNVHFLAMDGPFPHQAWSFKSDAKIPNDVAANVEIYIGKFKDDFTGIEKWQQVTHNNRGDYWSNVWIKPSKESLAGLAGAPETPEEKAPAALDARGLVYVWQTGSDGNQIVNPVTGAIRQCSGQLRGDARFARYYVMDLAGGSFVPDEGTGASLLAACKASNQFALETDITPTGPAPAGEKVIMAFADDTAAGNFVLAQQGGVLTLRLKTDHAGSSMQPIPICNLAQNKSTHLIISYANGRLAFYVNGKPAIAPIALQGGFSTWTAQPLVFGDTGKGGQNWTGLMEDVGLFSREIDEAEAHGRFLKQLERTKTRKPIETVVMDAKLLVRCAAPDPKGIAPYRRCLCEQLYQVEKIISGTCPDQKIAVSQWAVLDAKLVPSYEKMAVGQTYRLILEKMEDHPEQEPERNATGDFDANSVQLYYEVRTPDVTQAVANTPVAARANFAISANAPEVVTITNPTAQDLNSKGVVQMVGHGSVVAAVVTNGGFDYTQAPQAQFTGGGGQGAAGQAVMGVRALDVTDLGSGYTGEPTVTVAQPDVAGGRAAVAVAQIDKAGGVISGVSIVNAGTGYLRAPQINFTGGGGSGAAAQATLCLSGIVITNGGSGYTSPPAITLTGADGQQGAAQAVFQLKTFRFTDAAANSVFVNSGALEQNGSALMFDWAAPGRPSDSNGKCGFSNTGTWTLQNSSCALFTSSSGSASWVGDNNSNSGVLSVLDHSHLGFWRLQNSGTLELGAGAVLGQSEYAGMDNSIMNTGNGVIRITNGTRDQPAIFGYVDPNGTGRRTIENGAARGSGQARITIGSGKDAATFTLIGGQVTVTNFASGSIEIQPGAMLALLTDDSGSTLPVGNSKPREARLMNAGELTLAGQLRVQSNHAAFTGIENSGTLTIRGDQAAVERFPNSAGPGSMYEAARFCAQILNRPGGVVQGTGTLAYTNSTGDNEARYLGVFNTGTIAPGQRNTQGQESYGALVLHNVNVRFGAYVYPPKPRGMPQNMMPDPIPSTKPLAGVLRIGIGGLPNAPARYDTLTLAGQGDCGRLVLIKTNGNALNIVPAPGFTPHGTYRIATASSVSGTFDALQYKGVTQVPYTVNYLPDGITATFP